MKRVKTRKPESYIQRAYRAIPGPGGLISSFASIKDTDLHILADRAVSELAQQLALQYRLQIEKYIQQHPTCARSARPAYKCFEVFTYLLFELLSTSGALLNSYIPCCFKVFSVDLNNYSIG